MLRTAIVGLGEVARWHRRGVEAAPGVELVAIADVDESTVAAHASRWDATGYTDLDAVLAEESVDWVHVCTPVRTHHDLATTCIEAGVHVLVEKPFVATRAEFESIIAAADEAGVRASVVHNQAYYRPFREACRRVRSGTFGQVHGVSVRWSENLDPRVPDRGDWVLDLPGGEFGEGIVHPIYMCLRAGGYPESEAAVSVDRIDTLDDGVGFDGIVVSYVTADETACTVHHHSNVPDRRRVEFLTENGHVTVDIATQSVRYHRYGYGPNTPYDRPMLAAAFHGLRNATRAAARAVRETVETTLRPSYSPHDTHTPVVEREARAIREGGAGPTPRAEADWANRLFVAATGGEKRF